MGFAELISKAITAKKLFDEVSKGVKAATGTLTPEQYKELKAELDAVHAHNLEIGAELDRLTQPGS